MKSAIRRARNVATRPQHTPVPLASGSWNRSHMFDLGAGRASREQMMRMYGISGTVFAIVSLLQESTASTRWHLYKKQPQDGRRRYAATDQGDDQRPEVITHAALSLWNKPNIHHSGFEFREGSNQHMELTGETFWVLDIEQTRFPSSMWYVSPARMEPVPDPNLFLVGWIYHSPDGGDVPLRVEEVIQEKRPDPSDPFRGAGPVASIMPNIQQQRYATEFQRNLFLNGADPGGIIQVPSRLSDAQFDEVISRWRESHQGIARAGSVGVLEGLDTKWIPGGQSNKDLEYGGLRLANRDEIREAWRMHKAMLGTVEDVNRANAQTAEEVFVAWQHLPRLERRRETLNYKLLPMFEASGTDSPYEFDFEDPSPVNQEAANAEMLAKCQGVVALVQAGADFHDALEAVGLPDMNMAEVRQEAAAAVLPPAPAAQPRTSDGKPPGQARDSYTLQPRNAKDPRGKVIEQLARDYPPAAYAWAYQAQWSGPVELPTDHVKPTKKWLDLTSPSHVAEFVEKLGQGKKLKPVVVVKTPGSHKPILIDGHHRYLAAEQEEVPVRAWVGTVDSDSGPWDDMHDYQEEKSGSQNILRTLSTLWALPGTPEPGMNGHSLSGGQG